MIYGIKHLDPTVSSLMQIGELSERAKPSHRTIHYYERLGLFTPVRREGAGCRYYDAVTLRRLAKTETQLKELTAFRRDILAKIARFQERIADARGRYKKG